jgi:o-succinylbenzoate synthase
MPTHHSIRLARITLREIHLPLVEPFRTAGGVVDVRRALLVELRDAEGAVAWSECVAESRPTYAPDTVDGAWLAIVEWIAPVLLGCTLEAPSSVHGVLDRSVRGNNMARAAIEMGCWALDAVHRERSLATILAEAVGAAPRGRVATGIALGMLDTPDALAQRVRSALAEGYRRIKVKIEPGRDVPWLQAARAAVGPDTALSADANCSYSLDDAEHRRALDAIDRLGLSMLEQPLAHDDLVRHAELQRRMRTPLCLDESIRTAADAAAMIALGSARSVNVKAGRVGGFQPALEIHERCTSAGIALWCGGMLETGIGRAYNVALASLPGFTEPGDLSPSARYWARDIVIPAWTMEADGYVTVPLDRPGLGVEVDVGYIDDLTVRAISLGDSSLAGTASP